MFRKNFRFTKFRFASPKKLDKTRVMRYNGTGVKKITLQTA